MIRIAIPIDETARRAAAVFALATPLRLDELIALAVGHACGPRAPEDKRERAVRATLDGVAEGRFVVAVNGRIFERLDAVVVCSSVATLRFFSPRTLRAT